MSECAQSVHRVCTAGYVPRSPSGARTQLLSRVRLFVTLWTVARQAPLPMGFFRQEYWSGLPRPPPGDLPNPVIEPMSLTSALTEKFFTPSTTWEAPHHALL